MAEETKKVVHRFVGHPNLIIEALKQEAKERNWEFGSVPENFNARSEWDDVQCLFKGEKFHARFAVQQMPGCCAVLIAHHIEPEPYTREAFDEVLAAIEKAAYEAGFGSLMMAQVIGRKGPEAEIWSNCLIHVPGWELSEPFINAKSGNQVVYLTKNLKQPGKRDGLEIELPEGPREAR